jgi:hypothetical protein
MRFGNSYLRAALAFVAVVGAGLWLWFDWDARLDGFAGHSDRRAAHASGILAGAEWKAMRAAGDAAPAADGGEGCASEACRTAQAQLGGLWAGGGGCGEGDRYRFADGFVEVVSHRDGKPSGSVRRGYRVVSAPVQLRPLRDREGRPFEVVVRKLPGDVEVFTIGRSTYVRRILRAADANTVRLVLVEQRIGRVGPASAMYIEGKPTSGGGGEVVYRRCPAA